MAEARSSGGRMRPGTRYEFLLTGRLSEVAATAFPELTMASSPVGGTVHFGPVQDQAHVRGLLDRMDSLGLTVVELRQLPD